MIHIKTFEESDNFETDYLKYKVGDYIRINSKWTSDFVSYPYAKIIGYYKDSVRNEILNRFKIEYFDTDHNKFDVCDDINIECIKRKMTPDEINFYELKKQVSKYNI